MNIVTIERKILDKNDQVAAQNRAFLQERGIFAINLISSPGSGKTSILERVTEKLHGTLPFAVIEGDIQTDLDARRLAVHGAPVAQIVTRGGCHLDAMLVRDALQGLDLDGVRLLVIENVGNLVCPAAFDLGEACKIVVVSTTEGDDKPLKYPAAFRNASVLLINKIDLAPHLETDPRILARSALQINPDLEVFEMSARTGQGIEPWCDWLIRQVAAPLS